MRGLRTLRSRARLLAAGASIAFIALATQAQPAAADHLPSAYCSATGDICQSVTRVDGVRTLRITLAAEYFTRYRLCVIPPGASATCGTFRIGSQNGGFGDSVRWRSYFPDEGSGSYDVVWRALRGGGRIGRRLGFHLSA